MRVCSRLGCGSLFANYLFCRGKLLGHRGGVQRKPLQFFAIGRIPYINNSFPITSNNQLGIVAGNSLGGNVTREYKITLLATVPVPESCSLVTSTGHQHAVHGARNRRSSSAMYRPALELAGLIHIKYLGAPIHAG